MRTSCGRLRRAFRRKEGLWIRHSSSGPAPDHSGRHDRLCRKTFLGVREIQKGSPPEFWDALLRHRLASKSTTTMLASSLTGCDPLVSQFLDLKAKNLLAELGDKIPTLIRIRRRIIATDFLWKCYALSVGSTVQVYEYFARDRGRLCRISTRGTYWTSDYLATA